MVLLHRFTMYNYAHADMVGSEHPFILTVDIDVTLLGDEAGEAALKELVERHPRQVMLAFVTGRSLATIAPLIQENRLPQPDYICADVGTELYDCHDPTNLIKARFPLRGVCLTACSMLD